VVVVAIDWWDFCGWGALFHAPSSLFQVHAMAHGDAGALAQNGALTPPSAHQRLEQSPNHATVCYYSHGVCVCGDFIAHVDI